MVDSEPVLIFYQEEGGRGIIYAVSATPELKVLWQHDVGYFARVLIPGRRPYVLVGQGGDEPLNTLYKTTANGLVEVTKFPGSPPTCAEFIDLDRDGEEELYFSTGLDLEVARIDLLHPGASAPRVVVDTRGTLESYGNEMISFPIAGEPALALALRGFRAHDVRILQLGTDGLLTTRFRRKMGTVIGMARIQRLGETLLAVANVPWDAAPTAFGADKPYGEPPGIYLFRVTNEGLEQVVHLPIDLKPPKNAWFRSTFVGDFNGDGLEDLAVNVVPHESRNTIFFLQREDGSFVSSVLGDSNFRGAFELDGDRGTEALVILADEQGYSRLWVMGAGEEDIPVSPSPDLPPTDPPAEQDPQWVRRWSDAVDLGQLGMRKLGAVAFDQLAQDAVLPASKVGALRWAAAMRAGIGDDEGRFTVLQRLAALDPNTSTFEELYRLGRFLGYYAQARQALASHIERTPLDATNYTAELTRLALLEGGGKTIETRFDRPLGSEWVIEQPAALRRRPTDAVLEVATSSAGPLAWLPIDWDGNALELDMDIMLRHTEWGTGFSVEIVPDSDPTGAPILTFEVGTMGTSRGVLRPSRLLSCVLAGQQSSVFQNGIFPVSTDDPLRLQAKGRLAPVIGEAGCSLTGEAKGQSVSRRVPLASKVAAGAYRVVIRSAVGVPSLLHVDLHRLIVRGASVREHPVQPTRAAIAHELVEGNYQGALALADEEGMSTGSLADRMVLSEAMILSGRLAEVQTTWRELLAADPPRPQLDALLTAQLRRSPRLFGSLLATVSPEQQFQRVVAAWRNFATNHRGRKELRPRFWEAVKILAVDRSPTPKDAVDALRWRGLLLADVGDHQAGLRELDRALKIIAAAPEGAPVRDEEWVVALAQAKLAVGAGNQALAESAIQRARQSATMPLVVEDRLHADPELATLAVERP